MIRKLIPFLQLGVSILILFAVWDKKGDKNYDPDVRFTVEEYYLHELKMSAYVVKDLKTGVEHIVIK